MSTATKQRSPKRGFTGWHMVAVMSLFFGTVISVNLVMAWNASRSWSGLVVENTYVASQQFNGKVAEGRAFQASGIKGRLTTEPGAIRYVLTRNGEPEQKSTRLSPFSNDRSRSMRTSASSSILGARALLFWLKS